VIILKVTIKRQYCDNLDEKLEKLGYGIIERRSNKNNHRVFIELPEFPVVQKLEDLKWRTEELYSNFMEDCYSVGIKCSYLNISIREVYSF